VLVQVLANISSTKKNFKINFSNTRTFFHAKQEEKKYQKSFYYIDFSNSRFH
jgi:hypothetical protein